MAEYNNSALIGSFSVKPTSTEKADLKRMDRAVMEGVRHSEMHDMPASFMIWSMAIHTPVAASSTGNSLKVNAPWPLVILAADVGCESAAGASGTMDVYVAGASILDAPEDVKTTAGTAGRVAPEADSQGVPFGSEIFIQGASGGGGTLTGGQAHLYIQRG